MGVVKRKYRLRVNSIDKIEELLQEIYDEADKTIVEVQNQLNKLTSSIDLNNENGVYSILKGKLNLSNLTEIALKQEVNDGEAQLLCTVNGNSPKLYSCRIKKRSSAYLSATQNLIVTVTDGELLNTTGGIVQGM